MSRRSLVLAYVLWVFFGIVGGHRFYVGHYGWGFLYMISGGLFGIGWFVDAFLLPGLVDAHNRELQLHEPIPSARIVAS